MGESNPDLAGCSSVDLTAPSTPLYWTPLRQELRRWLEDRTPSFVEGYAGAVTLLHEPKIPGRVHFVCHVVRDIYRFLPAALGAKSSPRPIEVFPGMAKRLTDLWEQQPEPFRNLASRDANLPRDVAQVSVSVHRYVQKIANKSLSMKSQPTVGDSLALALFQAHEHREDSFIPPHVIAAFNAEYDWFVSRAHLATSLEKAPDDEGLLDHFESFERAFHSLIGPYFSGKDELDAICSVETILTVG